MVLEHRLFRAPDHEALAQLVLALDLRRVFAHGHGQATRVEILRPHPAAIERHAADADEAPGASGARARDLAQPAVGGHYDVETAFRDRRRECGAVVRVDVEVLDVGRDLVDLVGAAVEDRRRIAARAQPVHDVGTGRPGAADDERARRHDASSPYAGSDEKIARRVNAWIRAASAAGSSRMPLRIQCARCTCPLASSQALEQLRILVDELAIRDAALEQRVVDERGGVARQLTGIEAPALGLAQVDAQVVGPRGEEARGRLAAREQRLAHGAARGDRRIAPRELVEILAVDRAVEILLAREDPVHRAGGDARGRGDVGDLGLGIALLREHALGGLEDQIAVGVIPGLPDSFFGGLDRHRTPGI